RTRRWAPRCGAGSGGKDDGRGPAVARLRRRRGRVIQEIPVRSLGELIDALTPPEPDPVTGRRRDTGVYHGARSADQPLLTSLDRLGGTRPPHTQAHLEAPLLRPLVRHSRPYRPPDPTNGWGLPVLAPRHAA